MANLYFLTKALILIPLCLSIFTFPLDTHAAEDEYEIDYESILSDLQRSRKTFARASSNPFDNVVIHAGIGLTNAAFEFQSPSGRKIMASPGGFQAALGLDLFSPNWVAEGVMRSFTEAEFDGAMVGLQEFDIKIYYKRKLQERVYTRFGLGLAGRYLDVRVLASEKTNNLEQVTNYRTPSSIAFIGIDQYLSPGLSLGAEISSRSAVIAETADQKSFDITLRLDTHF